MSLSTRWKWVLGALSVVSMHALLTWWTLDDSDSNRCDDREDVKANGTVVVASPEETPKETTKEKEEEEDESSPTKVVDLLDATKREREEIQRRHHVAVQCILGTSSLEEVPRVEMPATRREPQQQPVEKGLQDDDGGDEDVSSLDESLLPSGDGYTIYSPFSRLLSRSKISKRLFSKAPLEDLRAAHNWIQTLSDETIEDPISMLVAPPSHLSPLRFDGMVNDDSPFQEIYSRISDLRDRYRNRECEDLESHVGDDDSLSPSMLSMIETESDLIDDRCSSSDEEDEEANVIPSGITEESIAFPCESFPSDHLLSQDIEIVRSTLDKVHLARFNRPANPTIPGLSMPESEDEDEDEEDEDEDEDEDRDSSLSLGEFSINGHFPMFSTFSKYPSESEHKLRIVEDDRLGCTDACIDVSPIDEGKRYRFSSSGWSTECTSYNHDMTSNTKHVSTLDPRDFKEESFKPNLRIGPSPPLTRPPTQRRRIPRSLQSRIPILVTNLSLSSQRRYDVSGSG